MEREWNKKSKFPLLLCLLAALQIQGAWSGCYSWIECSSNEEGQPELGYCDAPSIRSVPTASRLVIQWMSGTHPQLPSQEKKFTLKTEHTHFILDSRIKQVNLILSTFKDESGNRPLLYDRLGNPLGVLESIDTQFLRRESTDPTNARFYEGQGEVFLQILSLDPEAPQRTTLKFQGCKFSYLRGLLIRGDIQ